jgi:hypothetical protein
MWKIIVEPERHRWQYGACALHPGYLRLQTHTQNIKYLFLFHYNNGCMHAPHCYVIRTLPVLLCGQNNSVGTVTGLGAGCHWVQIPDAARGLSVPHNICTGFTEQSPPTPPPAAGTEPSFPGDNTTRDRDWPLTFSAAISPLLMCAFMVFSVEILPFISALDQEAKIRPLKYLLEFYISASYCALSNQYCMLQCETLLTLLDTVYQIQVCGKNCFSNALKLLFMTKRLGSYWVYNCLGYETGFTWTWVIKLGLHVLGL